jgi:hypothetical protein
VRRATAGRQPAPQAPTLLCDLKISAISAHYANRNTALAAAVYFERRSKQFPLIQYAGVAFSPNHPARKRISGRGHRLIDQQP